MKPLNAQIQKHFFGLGNKRFLLYQTGLHQSCSESSKLKKKKKKKKVIFLAPSQKAEGSSENPHIKTERSSSAYRLFSQNYILWPKFSLTASGWQLPSLYQWKMLKSLSLNNHLRKSRLLINDKEFWRLNVTTG